MPSSSSSSDRAPSVASSSDLTRSPASTTSLPSLSGGSSSASSSSVASLRNSLVVRPLEHLAVLLPRDLWKPDSQTKFCDAFSCRARFSLLERRHHCRKCGGVFCGGCSSRTTRLLDTSTLDFLHPPKGTPLAVYASPEAPLLPHRVCDDCYNQIHGIPRKPLPVPAVVTDPVAEPTRSPARRRRTIASPILASPPPLPLEAPLPPDLAELATYPLRHPSAVCKASGGGRWVPAPPPVDPATRAVPGRLAPYEAALEAEARAAKRALENPVITDGEFQMRRPVDRRAVRAAIDAAASA